MAFFSGLSQSQWRLSFGTDSLLSRNSLKLKDFHKFDSAATGEFQQLGRLFRAVLIGVALEQTAALVEGKVTPRLSTLLDGIKDEKKVSLAVADPKLGILYQIE